MANTSAIKIKRGISCELLSKALVERLLHADGVHNVIVEHDVEICDHQIDVFWQFSLGGFTYKSILEARDTRRPLERKHVIAFRGVLEEIGGQPRAIMVSTGGYQSGAIKYARKYGIELLQISRIDDNPKPFTINTLSFAVLSCDFNRLLMGMKKYDVQLANVNFVLDKAWLEEQSIEPPRLARKSMSVENLRFIDAGGTEIGALRQWIQECAKSTLQSGQFTKEFSEPTFIVGLETLPTAERLKIESLVADYSVTISDQLRPFTNKEFATYLLKDVLGGTERVFMTSKEGETPAMPNVRLAALALQRKEGP